jgi:hypothetical protein
MLRPFYLLRVCKIDILKAVCVVFAKKSQDQSASNAHMKREMTV